MRLSLRSKLILSIITLILFFGATAIFVITRYTHDLILGLEKEDLEIIAIEQSHEVGQIFSTVSQLVLTIASHEQTVSYMIDQSDEEVAEHLFHDLQGYNVGDAFSAIYLMDKDGNTLMSTDPSFVGKNYSFREYFQKAISDEPYVDIAVGVTSGEVGYYFSHPIKDADGDILGIAVTKMKPERVHDAINVRSGLQGHIMLTDACGVIIHSDKEDRIFKSLGTLSEADQKRIIDGQRFPNIEVEPIQYDIVQREIKEIETSKTFQFFDEVDDEEELLSIVKIGDLPFFIVLEQEFDTIDDLASRVGYILGLFVLGAVLLSVLVAIFLINSFLKPLKPLKEAAHQLSKGRYEHRVDVKNKDELGELADSFNSMAKKIQQSRANIEKKVAERTAQLEKINKFMTGRELKMVELKKKLAESENREAKK